MSAVQKLIDALRASDHGPHMADLADAAEAEFAARDRADAEEAQLRAAAFESRQRRDAELLAAWLRWRHKPVNLTVAMDAWNALEEWAAAKGGAK